jgi:hypothetical protein
VMPAEVPDRARFAPAMRPSAQLKTIIDP